MSGEWSRVACTSRLVVLLFGLLVGLQACSSSGGSEEAAEDQTTEDETAGVVTAGTLSGFAFTVIDGEITQDEEDGPVTAGAEGALIAFDDSIETLAESPTEVFVFATVSLDDGGNAVGTVFGSPDDLFAESESIRLERAGAELGFWVLNGLDTEEPPTEGIEEGLSEGDVYISGNFYNGEGGSGVAAFYPGSEMSALGCGLEVELPDGGNGSSLGIHLAGATLSGITISAPVAYTSCDSEGGGEG